MLDPKRASLDSDRNGALNDELNVLIWNRHNERCFGRGTSKEKFQGKSGQRILNLAGQLVWSSLSQDPSNLFSGFELPQFIGQGGPDVVPEKRMGVHGTGLEFRVELAAQEPGVVPEFDDLHQLAVGGGAGNRQAGGVQFLPVGVVEFVAVPVALHDLRDAIGPAQTIVAKLPLQPSNSFFRFTARNYGWRWANAGGKIDATHFRIAYIFLKG